MEEKVIDEIIEAIESKGFEVQRCYKDGYVKGKDETEWLVIWEGGMNLGNLTIG